MKKLIILFSIFVNFLVAENLLLLSKFDEKILEKNGFENYLMSEKLDGVRAFWDTKTLKSRSGKAFNAPKCWTKHLPPFVIDGELFIKNQAFEELVGIVNSGFSSCETWEKISFYIFDAPNASGTLLERLSVVQRHIDDIKERHPLKIIKQEKIHSKAQLYSTLKAITEKGGEGLVVRKNAAPYEGFRTQNAMKLKSFEDAECKVVAHNKGRGKFEGKMGSISCELIENDDFKNDGLNEGTKSELKNEISLQKMSLLNESNSQELATTNKNVSQKNEPFLQNFSQNQSIKNQALKDEFSQNQNPKNTQISQKNSQKIRFKIGSGFSDKERSNPPPIGSIITFKFNGYTKNGLPKFPTFLRLYNEQ